MRSDSWCCADVVGQGAGHRVLQQALVGDQAFAVNGLNLFRIEIHRHYADERKHAQDHVQDRDAGWQGQFQGQVARPPLRRGMAFTDSSKILLGGRAATARPKAMSVTKVPACSRPGASDVAERLVVIHHEDVSSGLAALTVTVLSELILSLHSAPAVRPRLRLGLSGVASPVLVSLSSGYGKHRQDDFPVTASVLRPDDRETLNQKASLVHLAAAGS